MIMHYRSFTCAALAGPSHTRSTPREKPSSKRKTTLRAATVQNSLGASCMVSMEKTIMTDRLLLLNALIEGRRLINKPMTEDEIPKHILEFMLNPTDHPLFD